MLLRRPVLTRRWKRRQRRASRAVRLESLEPRMLLTGLPYGAEEQDTAEYLLGNVVATVVFFESDGSIDPSTEDWNELVRDQFGEPVLDESGQTISVSGPNLIEETKQRVIEGLEWWETTLENFYARMYDDLAPIHSLNFIFDFEYAHNPIDTGYEPISRRSNDYVYWVGDFLDAVGFNNTGWIDTDIRSFNNAQRLKYNADWAYTIFVANDYNDLDGRFKSGGSFSQAFSFAGGRFMVSPARRPSSTFAHESGHIFYARDEYEFSGASYVDRRGYYNSQNWNAWDNPTPGFVQQPSIMDAGTDLEIAWQSWVSSDSSLAMIGWQDSDSDGVFDVLDVPLSLDGSGYYDPALGTYRFVGHSQVNTLPNINSSGRRNDITLNEVSQVVYSLDDGQTWTVAKNYSATEADIDFTVQMSPGQSILIRTQSVDPLTQRIVVTSAETFRGSTELPTAVPADGLQGFVWYDKNNDGSWTPGERGVPGWTLQLVDPAGQPLYLGQRLEPDDYDQYEVLNNELTGVTLTAVGYDTKDSRVGAVEAATSSTGQKAFGLVRYGATDVWVTEWTADSRNLRIDFATPTTTLSIDAIAAGVSGYGRLEAYDASGSLVGRYTTGLLEGDAFETMTVSVSTPQIAYAIARSTYESTIRLDHLRAGPESTVTTNAFGAFGFLNLPAGDYHVLALPSDDWDVTAPVAGIQDVTVDAEGHMVWDGAAPRPSDFAGQPSPDAPPWRNPINHLDINNDYLITPIDALLVINELNRNGSHPLQPPAPGQSPPPFYDATGDGYVAPLDALWVINYLNRNSGGGLSPTGGSGGGASGGGGEGEAWGGLVEAASHAPPRYPAAARNVALMPSAEVPALTTDPQSVAVIRAASGLLDANERWGLEFVARHFEPLAWELDGMPVSELLVHDPLPAGDGPAVVRPCSEQEGAADPADDGQYPGCPVGHPVVPMPGSRFETLLAAIAGDVAKARAKRRIGGEALAGQGDPTLEPLDGELPPE